MASAKGITKKRKKDETVKTVVLEWLKERNCSKNKVVPEHFGNVKKQFLLYIKQLFDLETALIIN